MSTQWADPVTGSSAMPSFGAKNLETKIAITFVAARRHDQALEGKLRNASDIRAQIVHLRGISEHCHSAIRLPQRFRTNADRAGNQIGVELALQRQRRKVHREPSAVARDLHRARKRLEPDALATGIEHVEDEVAGREGGVAAQRHLYDRCEPSQTVRAVLPYKKRRFGKVVFRCNSLQRSVIQSMFERTDGRRVTAEGLVGERVELIDRNLHDPSFAPGGYGLRVGQTSSPSVALRTPSSPHWIGTVGFCLRLPTRTAATAANAGRRNASKGRTALRSMSWPRLKRGPTRISRYCARSSAVSTFSTAP